MSRFEDAGKVGRAAAKVNWVSDRRHNSIEGIKSDAEVQCFQIRRVSSLLQPLLLQLCDNEVGSLEKS